MKATFAAAPEPARPSRDPARPAGPRGGGPARSPALKRGSSEMSQALGDVAACRVPPSAGRRPAGRAARGGEVARPPYLYRGGQLPSLTPFTATSKKTIAKNACLYTSQAALSLSCILRAAAVTLHRLPLRLRRGIQAPLSMSWNIETFSKLDGRW